MFDLRRQVRIKQAKNALQEGRLDEAFAIASEKDIRDHRGGQILLERIVDPLLDRAANHLGEGRLRDALLDVERALQAGGNRPRAAQLRARIQEGLWARERDQKRGREAIDSAREHIEHGSLRTGMELLDGVPDGDSSVRRLRREAEKRERTADKALAQAKKLLAKGEWIEALAAAQEAVGAEGRSQEVQDLVLEVKRTIVTQISQAFDAGHLGAGADLLGGLRSIAPQSLEARPFEDSLTALREAARACQESNFEIARAKIKGLQRVLPRAAWLKESLDALEKVSEGISVLRSGPLGTENFFLSRAHPKDPAAPATVTMLQRNSPFQDAAKASHAPRGERFLLWVDGMGTYLLLTSDRIAIGRSGSSSRPEIALPVNIAGYHAEILRCEEDYFVVSAQGTVEVDGRATPKKLLSHGEELALSPQCQMAFELPTPMSSAAVLSLKKGLRIERDVRHIILLKDLLLLGPSQSCHVKTRGKGEPVILNYSPEGFTCRAQEGILVQDAPAGLQAAIPLGAHIQVGDLTFAITMTSTMDAGRA